MIEEKTTTKNSKNERKSNSDDELSRSKNNMNENGYESDYSPRVKKNNKSNNRRVDRLNIEDNEEEDYVTTIRKPKVVTAYDSDEERRADEAKRPIQQQQQLKSNNNNNLENNGGSSLIEKKKLKWQADKQAREQLQQQEVFDRQKFNQSKKLFNLKIESFFFKIYPLTASVNKIQDSRASVIPRTGHTPEPPKTDLSLGQKKRLQWQKEKGNNFALIGNFEKLNKKN